MKIIIICVFLIYQCSSFAQEPKKRPSWAKDMPERSDSPNVKLQIEKDNDFGLDRSSLGFGRDENASLDEESIVEQPATQQLSNKVEIQKKLDEERKKNAAQLEKIKKLEAEKVEAEELARQQQAELENLAAISNEEEGESQKENSIELKEQEVAADNLEELVAIQTVEEGESQKENSIELKEQEVAADKLEELVAIQTVEEDRSQQKNLIGLQEQIEAELIQAAGIEPENDIEYSWKKIKNVAPMYPQKAERAKAEGWIDIEIVVDINGLVIDARVLKSKENTRLFDRSSLRAVKQWEYDPPVNYGIKSAQTKTVRMFYRL